MNEVILIEILDGTEYTWRLMNDLEPTQDCYQCEKVPGDWMVTSNEEMGSMEYFCSHCASDMLSSMETRTMPTTHQGEAIVWYEGSDDGNLEEGWAVMFWDAVERDYGFTLCKYYEKHNRNRIYTKERR